LEKICTQIPRRIFFPELWSAEELANWGVEKVELKTKYGLKQALIILIVLTSILSCNESNNKREIKTKVKTVKPIAENSDFGFN
jgi:hypothetical protein